MQEATIVKGLQGGNMIGKLRWAVSFATLFSLLFSSNLIADLKYEQTTLLSGGILNASSAMMRDHAPKNPGENKAIVYVSKDKVRVDNFSGEQLDRSMIYSIADGKLVSLNHQFKTYSQMSFDQFRRQASKFSSETPKFTTSIKHLGENREINGFHTHHYSVVVKFADPNGHAAMQGGFEFSSDVWLCKDKLGLDELEQFRGALLKELGGTKDAQDLLPPQEMTHTIQVLTGLDEIKKLAREMKAVPIRIVASFNIVPPDRASGSSSLSKETPVGEKAAPEAPAAGGERSSGSKKISISNTSSASGNSVPFLHITRDLRSIKRTSVKKSLFEIPKEYRFVSTPAK
jgi:hypothetical protein